MSFVKILPEMIHDYRILNVIQIENVHLKSFIRDPIFMQQYFICAIQFMLY